MIANIAAKISSNSILLRIKFESAIPNHSSASSTHISHFFIFSNSLHYLSYLSSYIFFYPSYVLLLFSILIYIPFIYYLLLMLTR